MIYLAYHAHDGMIMRDSAVVGRSHHSLSDRVALAVVTRRCPERQHVPETCAKLYVPRPRRCDAAVSAVAARPHAPPLGSLNMRGRRFGLWAPRSAARLTQYHDQLKTWARWASAAGGPQAPSRPSQPTRTRPLRWHRRRPSGGRWRLSGVNRLPIFHELLEGGGALANQIG